MKKLLMKMFPGYFYVCNHITVDFEDIEESQDLMLQIVDEDTNNAFDMLGISDERGIFIQREVKKAMIDYDSKVLSMNQVSKKLKHINEFYIAALIMDKYSNDNGMSGLMEAMLNAGRPDDSDK